MIKKILILLVAALIIIQFFRPSKNLATKAAATTNDISSRYQIPDSVKQILKTSCFDCHSNNTVYPWYSNFQPVGWWLNFHINEGKLELNFNEFASYKASKQYHKMEEVEEQIEENKMPLSSYTFIHTEARLSEKEKQRLIDWTKNVREAIKVRYPPDSLEKRSNLQ